ncbi:hypothetical protein F2Q68_00044133 [Brassica cretica]|uniref:Uncharacterized protein n=1 Tax=Brassica cretica TaxID=69181 RepID=A0A8S9LTH1_BRACR|nr:hypothetical protein F2Q68_00044133 [Brassica cretica]
MIELAGELTRVTVQLSGGWLLCGIRSLALEGGGGMDQSNSWPQHNTLDQTCQLGVAGKQVSISFLRLLNHVQVKSRIASSTLRHLSFIVAVSLSIFCNLSLRLSSWN